MIRKPIFAFLLITILISTFAVMIISHELTHYALGDTATGICLGYCKLPVNEHSFGTTYNVEPSSIGHNELVAWGVCLVVAGEFIWGWGYILFKRC